MPRQILIVDDIRTNREILKNILGDEYSVIEASDGQEALAVMERGYKDISAVLLDLGMPVMDGFQVLSRMRASGALSQLPVIVTTGQTDSDSEERALQLGAKDYISKPYKSAIIKQRIRNTINLRETAATVNALQRDRLTGLLSREAFFERVPALVAAHEPGHYVMACFDIDSFKVINDQYGTEKGDEVLRHVAVTFQEGFSPFGGVCCRVMADNFAVLYPASLLETDELAAIRKEAVSIEGLASPVTFSIGRYVVCDTALAPSGMYDRATLAKDSIKGRYDQSTALYDESMRASLLDEQQIVTEMDAALTDGQFEVWFQPQYNHASGALIGAEALVRWRHPERGMVPPGAFIPIFEKNGFIYELDKYVWEAACRYLRRWTDEGRAPLPIAVNISRYDIFRSDLVDVLTGLVARYRIPVELLRLEVTESAFATSTTQIVETVKRLVTLGFTVEIDDFGSGYSSLNTLKSVPAQVVKLDMHFLEDSDGSTRGGNILESIVRMAKWLGMSVIAEGVEEKRQADFLKSIGCSYVQGYLYASPMPADKYETLCKGAGKEERLLTIETVENLDNNAFWDPASMDTLIFNSYVGAACIYEYSNGKIELIRATDKYAEMLLGPGATVDEVLKLDLSRYLDESTGVETVSVINAAIESKSEAVGEFLFLDLPGCPHETYLRSTMRVIATAGVRYLVYCISENITAQRQAERSERKVIKQLQAVMDHVNCGITAVTINGETVDYLLANNRYYELLGYTQAQYIAEINGAAFDTIHPEDRQRVAGIVSTAGGTGVPVTIEYRAVRRDGSIIWLHSSISITSFAGVDAPVHLTIYTDITAEKLASQELLDNLPGGAALYEFDGKVLFPIHLNKRYWELVGRAPLDYDKHPVTDAVHPDDRAIMAQEIASGIAEHRDIACDVRIRSGKGGYQPFHIAGRAVPRADGKYSIYASYTPISDEAMSIQEMLPIALTAVMSSSPELSFVKDKSLRYICCSRVFAKMVGLTDEQDVIGKTDYDLFNHDLAAQYVADDRALMEDRRSIIEKIEHIPSDDGRNHFSSTSKYLLYDSLGNVVGLYGTGRDITETREMQSELSLLTNSVPGGIAVYEGTPDRLDQIRLSYFSDGFCRLFGYTREEYRKLADTNPLGLVFSADLSGMMERVVSLVQNNVPLDLVYRARAKDGSFKWIHIKAVMGEPAGKNMTVNAVLFDVTEQQEALERLRVSEEENRLAIRHSGNVVCRYDVGTRTLAVSPSVSPRYGIASAIADVPDAPIRDGAISPETADAYRAFYDAIRRGETNGETVFQRNSSDGWRWIEAHFSTIFSADKRPISAVVSFSDVTERFEKDAAYKRWQQSLHEKNPASYSLFRCNVSRGTILNNEEGSLLTVSFQHGGEPKLEKRVQDYAAQCVAKEDRERFIVFLNASKLLSGYYQGQRNVSLEYREKLAGQDARWRKLTVDLVESPHAADIEGYLLFEDIDEEKQAELKNLERAETDPLTHILNRTAFSEKVDAIIRNASPRTQHAMLMLDIDGFKQVNDAFGHSTGDVALVEVAASLRGALRRDDLVGRLGGDEFAVFLSDVPGDDAVAGKARQICALIRKSFSMEVEISASIGVAMAPRDGEDFESLYKNADSALYYVKGSGKDNYAFYHEDMADETLALEEETEDASTQKSRKKRRMLIVDDSRIDHAMLTSIFSEDFIVEKAKDGPSALIRLRHYGAAISVVLLDLVMPGMDGFAVLERMQQSAELRNIPVIVVSGSDRPETGLRAIRTGATDFVTKPVDPEILRVRVQSAISKAENERLRAKNNFLEYQNSQVARYRTVLERSGTVVVEHDWIDGTFLYDPLISTYLAGTYDNRRFWHILLSDLVADTATVERMQELVHAVATDRDRTDASLLVQLKTPARERHWFRMGVYKVANEFGLTGKFYLTFNDLGMSRPAEPAD